MEKLRQIINKHDSVIALFLVGILVLVVLILMSFKFIDVLNKYNGLVTAYATICLAFLTWWNISSDRKARRKQALEKQIEVEKTTYLSMLEGVKQYIEAIRVYRHKAEEFYTFLDKAVDLEQSDLDRIIFKNLYTIRANLLQDLEKYQNKINVYLFQLPIRIQKMIYMISKITEEKDKSLKNPTNEKIIGKNFINNIFDSGLITHARDFLVVGYHDICNKVLREIKTNSDNIRKNNNFTINEFFLAAIFCIS